MGIDLKLPAAIAVTLLLWASAYAGIKEALLTFDPPCMALLRYLIASAALAVYAVIAGIRPPRARDLPSIVFCGLLGIAVYHVLLNTGQTSVPAGAAGFLIGTSPVFTALLARFYLRERLSAWGWLGIVVSFCGVPLIALRHAQQLSFDSNALLILGAALCASCWSVYQKPFLDRYTALEFSAYVIWAGTACLLVFLPRMLQQLAHTAALRPVLVVGYLGVFPGALAYVTWTYVLSRLPVSRAVSFLYVLPVLSLAIAWVWVAEVPSLPSLAGGALALGGVIVVNRWGRVQPSPPKESPDPLPADIRQAADMQ